MKLNFALFRSQPGLTYSVGNILSTLVLLLLLPTLLRIDSTTGNYAAIGLLVSQIAAVLANYSFPVVTPRTLTQLDAARSQILLKEIFVFQVSVAITSLTLLFVSLPLDLVQLSTTTGTFLIGYSAVLQWQWFHISRVTSKLQSFLLLGSRSLALTIEIGLLLKFIPVHQASGPNILIFAALICLPIWPTLKMMKCTTRTKEKNNLPRPFRQFWTELVSGKDIFLASLLTSVYILGPSMIVAAFNPMQLVIVQQFDRLRISISGFTGMLLSTVYPLFLKSSGNELVDRFKNIQYKTLLPAVFSSMIFLIAAFWLPTWEPNFFKELHISLSVLLISISCAVAASASNIISLTLLHPLRKDRLYSYSIVVGSIIFIILIMGILISGNRHQVFPMMLAASLAEISILFALWGVARYVIHHKLYI